MTNKMWIPNFEGKKSTNQVVMRGNFYTLGSQYVEEIHAKVIHHLYNKIYTKVNVFGMYEKRKLQLFDYGLIKLNSKKIFTCSKIFF